MQKKPHFNFAMQSAWKKSTIDFILLALALLICIILYTLYQYKLRLFNDLKSVQSHRPVMQKIRMNPQLTEYLQHAQSVQVALNVPWMDTFHALEMVKKNHPDIQFLSVEPNVNRKEINIKLKAEEFSAVTALLQSLRKSPRFGEAELVSQHIEGVEDEMFTVFELHLSWKI